MQQLDEIFDVVDEHDQVIAQATRAEVHARHWRHRAVHVLLFNSRGELVVQKRSLTKDRYPGCYDSSASGHVDTGETYDDCAVREFREELGVTIAPAAFQKHFKIEACADTGEEFVWIYSVRGDYQLVPNPAELDSVTPMSRPQLEDLLAHHPATCARSFRRIVREVIQRGLFPAL